MLVSTQDGHTDTDTDLHTHTDTRTRAHTHVHTHTHTHTHTHMHACTHMYINDIHVNCLITYSQDSVTIYRFLSSCIAKDQPYRAQVLSLQIFAIPCY